MIQKIEREHLFRVFERKFRLEKGINCPSKWHFCLAKKKIASNAKSKDKIISCMHIKEMNNQNDDGWEYMRYFHT